MAKTSFFQTSKIASILSRQDFEKIIYVIVVVRFEYCLKLYSGVRKADFSHLQLVENAAAHFLTGSQRLSG